MIIIALTCPKIVSCLSRMRHFIATVTEAYKYLGSDLTLCFPSDLFLSETAAPRVVGV